MRNMICCLALLLLAARISVAQTENASYPRYFIGWNPVAAPIALNLPNDDTKRFLPVAAGLEYGLALSAGMHTGDIQTLEIRVATGKSNRLAWVHQIHAGAYCNVLRAIGWSDQQWYIGGFIKGWDYYNTLTEIHFFNIAPYAVLGYKKQRGRFFVDARLAQTAAVLSSSSLEHTQPRADWFLSPWPSFMPVLPTLTINVGYVL